MPCGCTDNKNLKNKQISLEYTKDLSTKDISTKDVSTKDISIEVLKDLSLDEIIRLYQDGYNIETMQYSNYCSGTVTTDRSNTSGTENGIWLYYAYAQKVKPTSKCLKSVVLSLADDSALRNDMYVEIRKDSGGLPNGNPQSSGNLGHATIPGSSISTYPTFSDITIPLNILLSDSDITNGIWIVVCSQFYDPNSNDSYIYHYTKTGGSGTPNEHMAFKSGTLSWQGNNNWNLYFKTNMQAYSVPCPTPVISVSCPTSSVNQGSTDNITATITTAGTPNYTYKLYVDSGANPVDTYGTSATSHTFSHIFNESGGSHTYRVDVVDSCSTGAKTATNNCTVTISACPTPVLSVTCPTSPINQGSIGSIIASITTAGTPNYTYKLYVDAGITPVDTFGPVVNTSHTFAHTFNESGGLHTYKVEITDSCPTPGSKTASNTCTTTISVIGCSTPVVSVTCPTSPMNQGNVGSIVATVTTAGTPNYTYKLYIDSGTSPVDTYGPTGATYHTFAHIFNETAGSHTYRIDVIDSCTSPGPKTATNSCTLTIQSPGGCPIPIVSVTCPGSITQGSTGNVVATITTAGTPNYTYKLYVDTGTTPVDTFGPATNTSHTFSHIFSESVAAHTYKVEVTDSCISGALIGMDICSTTIQQQGIPAAGSGGAMMIAAIAAIGIAYFIMKKPPTK